MKLTPPKSKHNDPWAATIDFLAPFEGGTMRGGLHRIVPDPADGVDAVGYGTRDKKWVDLARKNGGLTEAQARQAAAEALESNRKKLSTYGWYGKLPDGARMAVDDVAFNMGVDRFLANSPKFIKAVNAGNWEEAAKQMDWGNNQYGADGKFLGNGMRRRNAARLKLWREAFANYTQPLNNSTTVDWSLYAPPAPKLTIPTITPPAQPEPILFGRWTPTYNDAFRQKLGQSMMNLIEQ